MGRDQPLLDCDIVMKGGITSGVVYPPAATRLAEEYRFHSVGGTSAGAIAAAATAAAELARQTGANEAGRGFERLATLGGFLGTGTHLFDLFQPDPRTRPYWRLVRASSGGRARLVAVLVGTAARLTGARRRLLLGVLPGVAVLVPAVLLLVAAATSRWSPPALGVVLGIVGVLAGLVVLVAGAAAGAGVGVARRAVADLAANRFGLCGGGPRPGFSGEASRTGDRLTPGPDAALTVWLASELDGLAGVAGERRLVAHRDLEQLGLVAADGTPDRVLTVDDLRRIEPVELDGPGDRLVRLADLAGAGIDVGRLPPKPLTFGDLEAVDVRLRMITTDVTHGRPYRLPFEPAAPEERAGFFDPAALRELFPGHVVDWMVARPPRRPEQVDPDVWREWQLLCELLKPLRPLPDPHDLPVVVATRMSLSFPVLISAVPLYAVDVTVSANRDAMEAWRTWLSEAGSDWLHRFDETRAALDATDPRAALRPTRRWLSDGGITSNFPIHFFDSPLPRWPTFGFELRTPHPDRPLHLADEARNVWLPETALAGQHLEWRDVPSLWRFLRLVADTAQNWSDRTQMRVHGYWDRVVHVTVGGGEGGMNLAMPPEVIKKLGDRGHHAAERLALRFRVRDEGDPTSIAGGWDAHRWLRFRSSMALTEGLLGRIDRGYHATTQRRSRTYEQLLGRAPDEPPGTYPLTDEQRTRLPDATGGLLDLVADWHRLGGDEPLFGAGAPTPSPELRITPPI